MFFHAIECKKRELGIAGKIVKIKGQHCSRGKIVKQCVPEYIWQSTVEPPNQIHIYIHFCYVIRNAM